MCYCAGKPAARGCEIFSLFEHFICVQACHARVQNVILFLNTDFLYCASDNNKKQIATMCNKKTSYAEAIVGHDVQYWWLLRCNLFL